MISPPLEKMTRDQLAARIDIHESMAANFAAHHEEGIAREFREIAAKYRTELDTRPPDPPAAPKTITYRRPS